MGLSPRNLWDMKRFYERYYQVDTKLLQAVAVLPRGCPQSPKYLPQRYAKLKRKDTQSTKLLDFIFANLCEIFAKPLRPLR